MAPRGQLRSTAAGCAGPRGFGTIGAVLLQQAINALTLGSLYALIAIGPAITFSILDVVNFAQGSLVM